MEIAPDFFSYFEAAATLLDNDKYATTSTYATHFYPVSHLSSKVFLP